MFIIWCFIATLVRGGAAGRRGFKKKDKTTKRKINDFFLYTFGIPKLANKVAFKLGREADE